MNGPEAPSQGKREAANSGQRSLQRVLVIHVGRIGDTLLVTPTLRALRETFGPVTLGCLLHPARRELLEGLRFIDELGAITPKSAWYRGRLSPRRWDAALVYGRDAPLIRYAARIADRVVAFEQQDEELNGILWKSVPIPAAMHAVNERLLLAGALGAETRNHRLAYEPHPNELAEARTWLDRQMPTGRTRVGFQVASFATKSYRDWPLEHFTELGRRLLARDLATGIVVFGGKESRAPAHALVNALGARVVSAAGAFSLRETAALIAQLDLYVGVDTGPTHLAGALGIPMVALYHCRHRGRYLAPLQHERLRVIEHPASDADCSNSRPMSEISVDTVWQAAQTLLDKQ